MALNIVRRFDPEKEFAIIFDEYHHGYSEEKGVWALLNRPVQLGLIQAGIAFAILLLAVSRRFGQPLPLLEGIRQRSEYLTSMASLLRRASAVKIAYDQLSAKFLKDTAIALGLPPNANANDILEAAERRPKSQKEMIKQLVEETKSAKTPTESSLLAVARRWHRIGKDIKGKK